MMLVTITEEQTTHVGYQTRGRTPSTGNGMGTTLSRKSVKTNLSLLGSDCSMDMSDDDDSNCYSSNSVSSNHEADEWGFFIDSP